jgi:hypothetical protein
LVFLLGVTVREAFERPTGERFIFFDVVGAFFTLDATAVSPSGASLGGVAGAAAGPGTDSPKYLWRATDFVCPERFGMLLRDERYTCVASHSSAIRNNEQGDDRRCITRRQ